MRTPESLDIGGRKDNDRHAPQRPARRNENGPIGFREIMHLAEQHAIEQLELDSQMQASVLSLAQSHTIDANHDLQATERNDAETRAASRYTLLAPATPAKALAHVREFARKGIDSRSEIRLQLNPEHLGPLVIRMRLDGGRLRADLVATNPEAAAALEGGMTTLLQDGIEKILSGHTDQKQVLAVCGSGH